MTKQHHYTELRAAASLSWNDWTWTEAVTLLVIQLVTLPSCCQQQLMWCSEDNISYTRLNIDSVCNRKVAKLWKGNTKSGPYIKQAWTRARDSLWLYHGDKTLLVQNLLEQKVGLPVLSRRKASASWKNTKEKPADYRFLTSAFTTKWMFSRWIKRHTEDHFKRVEKEFKLPSRFQVCQF